MAGRPDLNLPSIENWNCINYFVLQFALLSSEELRVVPKIETFQQ